jgi:hypothetical protein
MFMLVKLIPDVNNWSKEKTCWRHHQRMTMQLLFWLKGPSDHFLIRIFMILQGQELVSAQVMKCRPLVAKQNTAADQM